MRERLLLHGTAALVAVAVLAPLVTPGYVLAYDMVFVPRQPLRWDLIAPVDALPRAVPLDTLVALATQVVPGWLVQKAVLAATIYAAAVGAGRLVPAERRLTRVVAAIGYAWTPYLAERLLIGHWGLLLCYAAMPWLVAAARDRDLPRLVLAAAVASVTPTGGMIAFATTCALVLSRRRADLVAVGATAALNAPWLLAALVTSAGGRSDPAGVAAFAARGENWSGPLGALAGTGGIWNAQTTPDSRGSPLVPLVTAVLLALAVAGFPVLRRRWPGIGTRLGLLGLGSLLLAAAGTKPGAPVLEWLVGHVPGAGLLRDGQKLLIPYTLVLVVCAALGAERINRTAVLVAAALLPVVVMPDLALGGLGRLRPVEYPRDWDVVAARIEAAPGPVVSLPFTTFRAYAWNRRHVAIDPAPRYFDAPVLVDDTLLVGDLAVAGENPRAAEIRRELAAGRPPSGMRWVLVQHDAGGSVPAGALAGLQLVHSGPELSLYENPAQVPASKPSTQWALPLAGHLLAAAVVLVAVWLRFRRRLAPKRAALSTPGEV